ncbi:MAG: hypothetical protein LBJ18_01665 [Rickettsiales bacterium]|nr:hypothetical protein [Rickettsiales bacterium]
MKKILALIFGAAVLTGCCNYYDYYRGHVEYTQDGSDCIYRADERGRHFSNDVRKLNADKKIVYNNTFCKELYEKDMAGQPSRASRDITIAAPATPEYAEPQIEQPIYVRPVYVQRAEPAFIERPVVKRRYVIYPM